MENSNKKSKKLEKVSIISKETITTKDMEKVNSENHKRLAEEMEKALKKFESKESFKKISDFKFINF